MIALDPTITELAHAGAVMVFNLSGGKDCGAAAALANVWLDSIGHPRDRRLAIHADTGRSEWPFAPEQVEAQAHALGLRLDVVRAKSGDLVDRFENRWSRGLEAYEDLRLYNLRGPWSSSQMKFCQSEKKIQVMGPHLARAYAGEPIVNIVGLRREESPGRKDTLVYKRDYRFAEKDNRAGTEMHLWHPIVDMLTAEVFAVNQAHGIPLAIPYGRGATRFSCALCVFNSANDIAIGAAGHPWLHRHYVALENVSTFSFQPARWLSTVRPDLLTPGLLADAERARARAAERRALELAMPVRLRFTKKGWPQFIPANDEAETIVRTRAVILAHHGRENRFDSPRLVIDRFQELHEKLRPAA